jgi:hypothetical protein
MTRQRNHQTGLGWLLVVGWVLLCCTQAHADKPTKATKGWVFNDENAPFRISGSVEAGFTAIPSHTIQLGKNGTNFDYVGEGAQNNLFLFLRLSGEVTLFKRHTLMFLYQPLNVQSQTVLRNELKQDTATFDQGEALDLRYGFDFYRVSYLFDIFPEKNRELSFGLSFQLRNATIVFTNVQGTKRSYRNDVGIVPILKSRGYFLFANRLSFGFEIDGFYAPISILNGSTNEVTGAILDASLRIGYRIHPHADLYFNVRYIGGGGVGTDSTPDEPGADGYVANWLHTFSFSLGIAIR